MFIARAICGPLVWNSDLTLFVGVSAGPWGINNAFRLITPLLGGKQAISSQSRWAINSDGRVTSSFWKIIQTLSKNSISVFCARVTYLWLNFCSKGGRLEAFACLRGNQSEDRKQVLWKWSLYPRFNNAETTGIQKDNGDNNFCPSLSTPQMVERLELCLLCTP